MTTQEAETPAGPQATVIPGVDSLIGDLLYMDLGEPSMQQQQMYPPQPTSQTPVQGGGSMDLLSEGLDSLVSIDGKSYCDLSAHIVKQPQCLAS